MGSAHNIIAEINAIFGDTEIDDVLVLPSGDIYFGSDSSRRPHSHTLQPEDVLGLADLFSQMSGGDYDDHAFEVLVSNVLWRVVRPPVSLEVMLVGKRVPRRRRTLGEFVEDDLMTSEIAQALVRSVRSCQNLLIASPEYHNAVTVLDSLLVLTSPGYLSFYIGDSRRVDAEDLNTSILDRTLIERLTPVGMESLVESLRHARWIFSERLASSRDLYWWMGGDSHARGRVAASGAATPEVALRQLRDLYRELNGMGDIDPQSVDYVLFIEHLRPGRPNAMQLLEVSEYLASQGRTKPPSSSSSPGLSHAVNVPSPSPVSLPSSSPASSPSLSPASSPSLSPAHASSPGLPSSPGRPSNNLAMPKSRPVPTPREEERASSPTMATQPGHARREVAPAAQTSVVRPRPEVYNPLADAQVEPDGNNDSPKMGLLRPRTGEFKRVPTPAPVMDDVEPDFSVTPDFSLDDEPARPVRPRTPAPAATASRPPTPYPDPPTGEGEVIDSGLSRAVSSAFDDFSEVFALDDEVEAEAAPAVTSSSGMFGPGDFDDVMGDLDDDAPTHQASRPSQPASRYNADTARNDAASIRASRGNRHQAPSPSGEHPMRRRTGEREAVEQPGWDADRPRVGRGARTHARGSVTPEHDANEFGAVGKPRSRPGDPPTTDLAAVVNNPFMEEGTLDIDEPFADEPTRRAEWSDTKNLLKDIEKSKKK